MKNYDIYDTVYTSTTSTRIQSSTYEYHTWYNILGIRGLSAESIWCVSANQYIRTAKLSLFIFIFS